MEKPSASRTAVNSGVIINQTKNQGGKYKNESTVENIGMTSSTTGNRGVIVTQSDNKEGNYENKGIVKNEAKCGDMSRLEPARKLSVAYSESSQHWTWRHTNEPRFREVAELLKVFWLDITASIKLAGLPRSTTYAAYLIFKMNNAANRHGLNKPQQARLALRNTDGDTYFSQDNLVCVDPERRSAPSKSKVGLPVNRSDGWMELELGQFSFDHSIPDQELEAVVSFENKDNKYEKRGLIVAGIEVRPIKAA